MVRTTEFVESYIDAWNHRDPKGVADHLAANGVYRDVPENVQRNHDELITSLADFFSNVRHRYELIGNILSDRNTIAFQYRVIPISTDGAVEPAQKYRGAEFMTLNGDAAVEIIDYYDIPGLGQHPRVASIAVEEVRKNKYARSGLDDEHLQRYMGRLQDTMEIDKAYLRFDLTLPSSRSASAKRLPNTDAPSCASS